MIKLYLISAFTLCNLLFSETINEQLIHDNPLEISLMDTSDLDPKLKLFLNKFYQKNYLDGEFIKTIKSMQFVGTYYVGGEKLGTIKIIKKRPNKYKSHLKKYNNTEQITIYDGKTLKKGQNTDSDSTVQWQTLATYAPENLWIQYEQLFDSILLNPNDPNKEISLGIPFLEDGQVIQAVTIQLKNKVKITNFIPIRNNLTKRTLIEFNDKEDPEYTSYTLYFEDYESVNGIMFPKKITSEMNDDPPTVIELSDIEFNLGVSDFFFKAISF